MLVVFRGGTGRQAQPWPGPRGCWNPRRQTGRWPSPAQPQSQPVPPKPFGPDNKQHPLQDVSCSSRKEEGEEKPQKGSSRASVLRVKGPPADESRQGGEAVRPSYSAGVLSKGMPSCSRRCASFIAKVMLLVKGMRWPVQTLMLFGAVMGLGSCVCPT